MIVELRRGPSTEFGTFGELFIDNEKFCVTVERPSTGDHSCIPALTYQCNRFKSPHNGDCWLLLNVPGKTMIEIHRANLSSELRGCIAPGKVLGELNGVPAVLDSKTAMAELYNKLGNSFKITIIEP